MPTVAIEFYDSGVRICDGEKILAESESYALIDANHILVGELAKQQAYLRPREISTQFWTKLSGKSTTKHVLNHVDIALKHLEEVWGRAQHLKTNVILITSTIFDKTDLGLLLGICKKLDINVLGIVCNAAVSLQNKIENSAVVFLDLQQTKIIITELSQNEVGLSANQKSHVLDYGMNNFTHNFAKVIAKQFVEETRFDPLHSATNEQQFFDKLFLWMETLKQKDTVECSLLADDKRFTIELHRNYLNSANLHLFNEIAHYLTILFHRESSVAIICSASCKQVFGFFPFLSQLPGCAAIQLDAASLSSQALRHKKEISAGDEIHLFKKFDWQSTSIAKIQFNKGNLSNLANQPTHILINGHAYSLKQTLYLSLDDQQTEPIVSFSKSTTSICRLFNSNIGAQIEVLISKVKINQHEVNGKFTLNINDYIELKKCVTTCKLIKVIEHET